LIRATITSPSTGKRTLLLGVDRENMNRLTDGKPIFVKGEPLGVNCDVVIVFGESLDQVVEDMHKAGIHFPPPPEGKADA
jgi:hypothetical protein